MSELESTEEAPERAWRERAVSRSLNAARSRAEVRVQRFLDAAFELIDEKGTTEFTIQLHEWCDPSDKRRRSSHNRRPIMDFSVQLAADYADRVNAAMAPISKQLIQLIVEADAAGAIDVTDPREAAAVVQQTVMNSWFGNRLIQNAKKRLSAEAIWE